MRSRRNVSQQNHPMKGEKDKLDSNKSGKENVEKSKDLTARTADVDDMLSSGRVAQTRVTRTRAFDQM